MLYPPPRGVLLVLVLSLGFTASAAGQEAPATAPTEGLGGVSDFGQLDLEMTTVTDFNQLDLSELLDAKVETASKKSESISRAPAIIEVLTREQIYNLGARDLYTALSYLPGIEIIETYGGTTNMVFRGMPQEAYNVKILFLINGHPIFEPGTSGFLLETIPLEAIKRIEVIRGPGSVLYGTNAFAGVINVITETQKEDGATTVGRLEAGQFTTFGGGAGNYGKAGNLNWGVFVGGNQSRGYPYRVHKNQNEDCVAMQYGVTPDRPYDCLRPGLSGTLEYFNNYRDAYLDLQYSGVRLQAGGVMQEKQKYGLLPALRHNGTNEQNHYFGELSYRRDWETFGVVVRTGWNHDTFLWNIGRFPYESFDETHIEGDSDMYRGELTASWQIVESLGIDQGISYDSYVENKFHFLLASGAFHPLANEYNDLRQNTASYYAQIKWDITPELTAIGGFRVSRFQTDHTGVSFDAGGIPIFEKTTEEPIFIPSPRAGLIYAPREEITFKALYGEAFRLPNLWETNATLNKILASAPNIQPEIIRTAEFGVDTRPAHWLNVRVNGYYSIVDDLLARRGAATPDEWALLGASGGVNDNVNKSEIVGSEFSTQAIFNEAWSGFFNLSWKTVNTEVMSSAITGISLPTQLRFARPAPILVNLGASYKAASWVIVRPNAQYVGPRGYAKAYTLVNGVVDFPVTKAVTLSGIVNNLFNTNYAYPEAVRRGVGTIPGGPGRAYYGRITAEF